MVEIFVATSGRARPNPVTKEVRLDFEDKNLNEITIQIPFANLQLLERQARVGIGLSDSKSNPADPFPIAEQYRVTGHVVARTEGGVRLTTQIESATGVRFVACNLSPLEASQLADDLYEKATQSDP